MKHDYAQQHRQRLYLSDYVVVGLGTVIGAAIVVLGLAVIGAQAWIAS